MLAPVGAELMTIDLEPIRPPVLFLPSEAAAFDLIDSAEKPTSMVTRITRGREGDFEYLRGDERGLRYRVFRVDGTAPLRTLTATDRARYTSLPPGLPDRISDLARGWASNATNSLEVARRVEERLRTDYLYDLGSPSGAAINPLDHFLFESKRGHCEFYSTSMAVMLRTLGIPTRNVTGFLGASYNRFGRFYVVRQGEAHSWVEVYVEGVGWMRFDPTPSGAAAPVARVEGLMATVRDFFEAASERWDRHVVGYDLDQQMNLMNKVRGALRGRDQGQRWLSGISAREAGLVVALLGGIALGIWAWRRRRRGTRPGRRSIEAPDARIVALYHQLEDVLRQWGMPRGVGTPPLAHARAVIGLKHPQAAEVLQLTSLYLNVRFGRAEFSDEAYTDYARRVARLKEYRPPAAA
jgi:transglutaminase-like putative cysteine protease